MKRLQLAASFALCAAPALAQRTEFVVDPGQVVPGLGRVGGAAARAVNDAGSWAAQVDGSTGYGLVVNGVLQYRVGDALPGGGEYSEAKFVFLDNNGRVAVSTPTSLFGVESAVLLDGVEVARSNGPTGDPGYVWYDLRLMGFSDSGRLVVRGRVIRINTGTAHQALGAIDVDPSGTVVARSLLALEGQPLPAGLGNFVGPVRLVDVASNGSILWVGRRAGGSAADDDFLLLDQTLVALEGQPLPGAGLAWRPANALPSLTPMATSWSASGWIAGSAGSKFLAAVVDDVLVHAPGERLPSLAPWTIVSADNAQLAGTGELIWRAGFDHVDPFFGSALMAGDAPLFWSGNDLVGGQLAGLQDFVASSSGRFVLVTANLQGRLAVLRVDRLAAPSTCQSLPDAFEPNDDCTSAASLDVGVQPTVSASRTDDDWYQVTVGSGDALEVRAIHAAISSEVDLEIFDGACGSLALLAATSQQAADEGLVVPNQSGAARIFYVRVFVPARSAEDCAEYRLLVGLDAIDACTPGIRFADDAFEPNDACASAFPIAPGAYTGLAVHEVAADHYEVLVPPGGFVEFQISGATAPLDLSILAPGCTGVRYDDTYGTNALVTWSNFGDAPVRSVCRVRRRSNGAGATCAFYDLSVAVLGDEIGLWACDGGLNSTGTAADLTAWGDDHAIANLFELRASDLPSGAAGYFLASTVLQITPQPGGSQGDLCLGDPVGRIIDSVQFATASGQAAWRVDLSSIPQPTGALTVMSGDYWTFQFWYRDANPGPTSNFSDGLWINFR